MIKPERIIFKTGYARVTKVLNISGPARDRNDQAFKNDTSPQKEQNPVWAKKPISSNRRGLELCKPIWSLAKLSPALI